MERTIRAASISLAFRSMPLPCRSPSFWASPSMPWKVGRRPRPGRGRLLAPAHDDVRRASRADIEGAMRWASSLSRRSDTREAFAEAAQALEVQLGASTPDLLLAFASSEHAGEYERIAAFARRRFPAALVAGCTAGGVIGGAHEAEEGPALSLTAAALPGVALSAFHLDMTSLPPADGARAWHALVGRTPETLPKLLLLADPFTMD